MLPDHALRADYMFADCHASAGSKRMEMARRGWRCALLRSTRARCRTGHGAEFQPVHVDTRGDWRGQQLKSRRSGQLQECRDLEAQQRNDRGQFRRSGQCRRTGRASAGSRTSPRSVYGRTLGQRFSATGHGVRLVGCGTRRSHAGVDHHRYPGQANHVQCTGAVFCAAAVGVAHKIDLPFLQSSESRHHSPGWYAQERRDCQDKQSSVNALLQGLASSW